MYSDYVMFRHINYGDIQHITRRAGIDMGHIVLRFDDDITIETELVPVYYNIDCAGYSDRHSVDDYLKGKAFIGTRPGARHEGDAVVGDTHAIHGFYLFQRGAEMRFSWDLFNPKCKKAVFISALRAAESPDRMKRGPIVEEDDGRHIHLHGALSHSYTGGRLNFEASSALFVNEPEFVDCHDRARTGALYQVPTSEGLEERWIPERPAECPEFERCNADRLVYARLGRLMIPENMEEINFRGTGKIAGWLLCPQLGTGATFVVKRGGKILPEAVYLRRLVRGDTWPQRRQALCKLITERILTNHIDVFDWIRVNDGMAEDFQGCKVILEWERQKIQQVERRKVEAAKRAMRSKKIERENKRAAAEKRKAFLAAAEKRRNARKKVHIKQDDQPRTTFLDVSSLPRPVVARPRKPARSAASKRKPEDQGDRDRKRPRNG